MTDEEKKEYEELKSLLYTGTISQYGKRKLIEIIEKQQKEIEEIKNNIHLKEVYVLKTNDYIKGTNIEDELCNKKWKDKIKAKIQEVEQWELYNMKIPRLSTLDERLGAKIGIKYVLQSLLEKE